MRIEELTKKAVEIRRGIIEAVYSGQSGHPGGSLSIADIKIKPVKYKTMKINEINFCKSSV